MECFKTVSNLLKIHEKHDLNEKYVLSFSSKTMIIHFMAMLSVAITCILSLSWEILTRASPRKLFARGKLLSRKFLGIVPLQLGSV